MNSVRQFVLCLIVCYFCEGNGFRLQGYYIGCLEKSAFSKDINIYSPTIDPKNYVPKMCYEACFQKGYKLAGLKTSDKCYCTNSTLDLSRKSDEELCDYTCSGDDTKYCGGEVYRNVYATGWTASDSALLYSGRFFGCFEIEGYSEDKASFTDPNKLTPKLCYEACFQKGYSFAGLRHGDRCHCFNTRPYFSKIADMSRCQDPCPGGEDLFCGGDHHQSIYSTGLTARGFQPNGRYIGCFHKDAFLSDDDKCRGVPNFWPFSDYRNLTPKMCYEMCFWNGFKLARVQLGDKCICSNFALDTSKQTEKYDCDLPCYSDKKTHCGGSLYPSVYATGLSDIPAIGRLTGCFAESKNTLGQLNQGFADFREDLLETNSPTTCMNLCYQMGYLYAGLQAGYVCLCGNSRPDDRDMRRDVECHSPCTGSPSERCGGLNRLLVYKTPKADKLPGRTTTTTESPYSRGPQTSVGPSESSAAPEGQCTPSVTKYNARRACKNNVIFSDDFEGQIDWSKWKPEIKIAGKPDYEFTVYDSRPENLFTEKGALHIRPTINDDYFVEHGKIQYDERCTGNKLEGECTAQANHLILPPIQSARITSRQSFNFKYGIVEFQAKLPIGAWIVSEIALMPTDNTYGSNYNSGKIRFMSRGNTHLKNPDGQEIGNQNIEGSVMVGIGEDIKRKAVGFYNNDGWRGEFHNFTIIWRPDDILFLVDGAKAQSIMEDAETKKLMDAIGLPSSGIKFWSSGSPLAPFDQPFYISVGVFAGGVRDFEDNIKDKSWRNTDPRAMWKFWQHKQEWTPTWKDDTSLIIKSIKVTAL